MSEVRVNKLSPRSGTTVTLGDSGDTITIPSGVTLANSGTFTNFQSTGIDDNATSTAITIDSNQNVGIGLTNPAYELDILGADPSINLKDSSNATNQCTILADAGANIASLTLSRSGANQSSAQLNAQGNVANLTLSSLGNTASVIEASSLNLTIDVNGSERMRIDSSGNLLVGTTGTSIDDIGTKIYSSGAMSLTRSGNGTLFLNRKTSDGDIAVFYKDDAPVGSIGNSTNNLYLDSNAGAGLFIGGDSLAPRTSGSLSDDSIKLGTSSYRYKELYLSGGVYLGGTGTANKLDDYEEGSFTPNIVQGLQSITYVVREGHYTKIGRIVHFGIKIQTSAATAQSNRIEIGDLPFTTATSFDNPSQGAQLSYVDDGIVNSTTTNAPTLWIPGNENKIVFYNTAGTDFRGTDLANSNAVFYINGVYQTT